MALRLLSHHRVMFNPRYVGGSSSILTQTAKRLLTIDITTQQEFDEKVLQSDVPVIVDFHASWCGPCKALAPILNGVMNEYDGKVNLAKVDVDDFQDLAMDYGVMSVPTVLALKNGEIVDQFVGLKQTDDLHKFVNDLLEK